jgi:hypothetical protein
MKMKKITRFFACSAIALMLFAGLNAKAQMPKLGVGLNAGLPTTDDYYKIALGADLRLQFNVAKQLSIPFTVGYTNFVGKEINLALVDLPAGVPYDNKVPNYDFIPVKGGLKYFFDKKGSGMYGLAEVGAAFGLTRYSKVGFLYSPALGYSWSSGFDLGLKYEAISGGLKDNKDNIGQIAVRVAYGFKL